MNYNQCEPDFNTKFVEVTQLYFVLFLGIDNEHKCLKIRQLYCLQRFGVSLHLQVIKIAKIIKELYFG
jgi:hypothetical protein